MEKIAIFLILLFSLFPFFAVRSQGPSEETVRITTYYPSPYGSYKLLSSNVVLFNPADGPPDNISGGEKKGMLYFDKNEGFKYYNGKKWTVLGEAAASLSYLAGSEHTENDCVNAGGEVVATSATAGQCRFTRASCPSGWTQYKNWSTTSPVTHRSSIYCNSCTTGSHAWTNSAVETCSYPGVMYSSKAGLVCSPNTIYGNCSRGNCTGYADITQVGCY